MLKRLRQQFSRIAEHRGIRRYGANTLWSLSEKGCRFFFGFLVGIYVARQLGPDQYGLLNYAVSFVAIFSILSSLGMESIVVRELVRRPEKANLILGSALLLKTVGFAVMTLVLAGVLFMSHFPDSVRVLMIVILAGYGFQVFQVFDFSFQARVLNKYISISQISALAVTSGLRLYFAWRGAPLWCFAAVESAYMMFCAFGCAIFYWQNSGGIKHWSFDRAELLFLLQESMPLFLAGGASIFYLRFDQVMVTWMLGNSANGQYAVAVRLVEVFFLIPLAVSDSFFPSLIGTRSTSLLRYFRRTEQLMRFMFYLALVILPFAAVVGYFLIILLYGAAYQEAALLYVFLLFKILLVYPGLVCAKWYLAERMQKISMIIGICGCFTSILLDYLLIRVLGVIGVAVAAVLINIFTFLVFPLFFRKGRAGVRLFLRSMLPFQFFSKFGD